mgnify:CR=1 FL=1
MTADTGAVTDDDSGTLTDTILDEPAPEPTSAWAETPELVEEVEEYEYEEVAAGEAEVEEYEYEEIEVEVDSEPSAPPSRPLLSGLSELVRPQRLPPAGVSSTQPIDLEALDFEIEPAAATSSPPSISGAIGDDDLDVDRDLPDPELYDLFDLFDLCDPCDPDLERGARDRLPPSPPFLSCFRPLCCFDLLEFLLCLLSPRRW